MILVTVNLVPTPAGAMLKRGRAAWIKPVRAAGSWLGSMTTAVHVRNFSFRIDEPVAVGGTNSAPTPMEIIAGAVNGCITVVAETVAGELGIQLKQVETISEAYMDTRGFKGTAEVSPHFHEYALRIQVVTTAPASVLGTLRRQVEKRCPALNLLRDAGVPVELVWEFSTDPLAAGVEVA